MHPGLLRVSVDGKFLTYLKSPGRVLRGSGGRIAAQAETSGKKNARLRVPGIDGSWLLL